MPSEVGRTCKLHQGAVLQALLMPLKSGLRVEGRSTGAQAG